MYRLTLATALAVFPAPVAVAAPVIPDPPLKAPRLKAEREFALPKSADGARPPAVLALSYQPDRKVLAGVVEFRPADVDAPLVLLAVWPSSGDGERMTVRTDLAAGRGGWRVAWTVPETISIIGPGGVGQYEKTRARGFIDVWEGMKENRARLGVKLDPPPLSAFGGRGLVIAGGWALAFTNGPAKDDKRHFAANLESPDWWKPLPAAGDPVGKGRLVTGITLSADEKTLFLGTESAEPKIGKDGLHRFEPKALVVQQFRKSDVDIVTLAGGHPTGPTRFLPVRDGKGLVTLGDGRVVVWDLESGDAVRTWDYAAAAVTDVVPLSDNLFAVACARGVLVFSLKKNDGLVAVLDCGDKPATAAARVGEKHLAVGTGGGKLLLFDISAVKP